MPLLAINYHYIHEEHRYPFPGIHPTPPERFERQLKTLGRFFEFVSGGDLLAAVRLEKSLPRNACVITFDDGLNCQYQYALPVLKKLGIPALLFISMKPVVENKALDVHKIHWVRAHCPPSELLSAFKTFCISAKLPSEILADKNQASAIYMYDEPENALVKYYLNYKLPSEARKRFIDSLFSQLVPDEADWCHKIYLSPHQLSDLYRKGFLGSHTYNHLPLGPLDSEAVEQEIVLNQQAMMDLGIDSSIIAYPYGSVEAVTPEVAAFAEKAGYEIGFTMERARNLSLQQPLLLARIDTNDALTGKKPRMQIDGNGEIAYKDGLLPARNRYLHENSLFTELPMISATRNG